jgi:hypothetical protein
VIKRRSNASVVASHTAELEVTADLPRRLPLMKSELAIWRAFLADEIEAILRDGD